jgi:site-specific DNA-methyltransferase (adenine-specific)
MLDLNRIYNLDCMEGMKDIPDKYFELAITDPPYGNNDAIGILNGNGHVANRKDYKQFANTAPNDGYFRELKRVSKNQIIWGGNFFGLKGGYICWNKHGTAFGEAELAYCSMINSIRVFDYTWNGMLQQNMGAKERRQHPTQKPVDLYRWLLRNYAKKGDKILDTHLGSGSSIIACHDMGFEYMAFEIDADYFNAATRRIETHKAQLRMEL